MIDLIIATLVYITAYKAGWMRGYSEGQYDLNEPAEAEAYAWLEDN